MELLLKQGDKVDVNARTVHGWSPLHTATEKGLQRVSMGKYGDLYHSWLDEQKTLLGCITRTKQFKNNHKIITGYKSDKDTRE